MRTVQVLLGAAGLLLSCPCVLADRGRSEGTFVDSAGKPHRWSVARSHALLWDGSAYAPAGVVFHSHYLARPSEATFAEDREAIERLRAGGVEDVLLDPGRGLLGCRPEDTQRLLDLMETAGLRYGLVINDRSAVALVGYAPQMDPMPVPPLALQAGGRFQWTMRVRDARRLVYALVDAEQDWVLAGGEAPVDHEIAAIDTVLKKPRSLARNRGSLYILPERQVDEDEAGSFADLWRGIDDFQRRVTAYLKALRTGPGLRFILDPFDAGGGVVGAESAVFPSSQEFYGGFRDWLSRRTGINDINIRWAMTQTHINSLEVAARLVPTWPREDPPDQLGWLIDPVERTAYQVVPRRCRIWDDYLEYRSESLKRSMCQIAAAIRASGPNVPVIYSRSGYQPLFTSVNAASGYDGIGASLTGNAVNLATRGAAAVFAQAEQCSVNWWLIASRLSRPADSPPGASTLPQDWAALRELGFKGFFVENGQAPLDSDTLAGLKQVRTALSADRGLEGFMPKTCFFPALLPNSGRITRLANGVWWLPSLLPARQLQLGERLLGYQIEHPFGSDRGDVPAGVILWSPAGQQEATFSFEAGSQFAVLDTEGKPLKVRRKSDRFVLNLTSSPVVAVGINPDTVFPLEGATAALAEFDALLRAAEAENINSAAARQLYNDARGTLSPATAGRIYRLVNRQVEGLRQQLTPYHWIEGERPVEHNFNGSAFLDGMSDGRFLQLDRQRPARDGIYQARYVVNILKEATYQVWVAGRVPGQPGVSPLRWNMDSDPATDVSRASPVGEEYAPGFGWYQLGQATLQPGRHVLTLAVPERAGGDGGRYVFGIDAVLLSRTPFEPHGTERPNWLKRPANAGTKVAAKP